MATQRKEETAKTVKAKKGKMISFAECYSMQEKLDDLYARSLRGEQFSQLFDVIISKENILLAYHNLKRHAGSKTPGSDGLTIHNIEKMSVDDVVEKIRNILRNYSPRTVFVKE